VSRARAFHLLTFAVAAFAVVLQLFLVVKGHRPLERDAAPQLDLGTRIVRFCSYLTIWSNLLVAWSALSLAAGADRDSRVWRALRLDAVVICFGGGVVHFFLLRPHLSHATAWDQAADTLLHMVVPLLAVIGWVLFGPRRRAEPGDLAPFLVLPVAWLGYTLVRGAIVDWYPYPFLDVTVHGYPQVVATCVGVAALMFGLAYAAVRLDARLSRRGQPGS
jgi:hypothetical protein